MSIEALQQARHEADLARARLEGTVADAQQRLRPGSLAGEAWDGVKGKGADLAEGALKAVKKRPAAVSLALGAFALFLARSPIKRAVTGLVSRRKGEGIAGKDEELNAEAAKRTAVRAKKE